MREIEIKFKAKDFEGLKKKLIEKGCVLSEPIGQHDTIYSLGGRMNIFSNASSGDVVPRLRRLKDKTEFNVKQQKTGEGDNLEYETEIKDPEQIDGILKAMGYLPVVEVKKMRQKGKLGEYEVCLDHVEGLGSFIEIEKLANDDVDPEEVRSDLFKAVQFLGLTPAEEEVHGYDTQIVRGRS